jgi:hypothetical protein
VHELVSEITSKDGQWKDDLEVIPSENHISHRDLIDSSKDSQFWAKIHEFDPELCALVDLYKNDAKENRQRMLTDINSRFEWKNFLNKQKSNFSIGKLEYLLKKILVRNLK